MFRAREPQRHIFSARNQYLDLIDPESFYALLAKHGEQLFWDYNFEDMYCRDNGRPCIPPCSMFNLMMLQMFENCSDYEAIERSRFDIRWLAVLDLQVGERLCGRSTLQEFRARVHLNQKTEDQFKAILVLARSLGILKGSSLTGILDTTPVLGRGAVKDTYNLIADGIRRLVIVLARIAGVSAEQLAKLLDLSRYWEASSLKGEAKIDWSNEDERRVFLNGLVADAYRLLLEAKKRAVSSSKEDAAKVEDASVLLRRLISQDTEPVPGPKSAEKGSESPKRGARKRKEGTQPTPTTEAPPSDLGQAKNAGPDTSNPAPNDRADAPTTDVTAQAESESENSAKSEEDLAEVGTNGGVSPVTAGVANANSGSQVLGQMVQIRQGVAADRVISANDEDMRHGRKSASKRFDGHKLSVCVDAGSKLILSLDVIAGNAPDNQGALGLVEKASANTGIDIRKVLVDCAYGDGATRKEFDDAGIELSAKMPSPPANDPYHKGRFVLDLTNKIATCPAGHTTSDYDFNRHRRGVAERFCFPAHICQACPHKEPCLRNADQDRSRGRTIALHPQEELLQRARQHQATPAFREDIKARQVVEHRQARMVQLGSRQARYFGRAKTKFQMLMIAMVANLTLMAKTVLLFALIFSVFPVLSLVRQASPQMEGVPLGCYRWATGHGNPKELVGRIMHIRPTGDSTVATSGVRANWTWASGTCLVILCAAVSQLLGGFLPLKKGGLRPAS